MRVVSFIIFKKIGFKTFRLRFDIIIICHKLDVMQIVGITRYVYVFLGYVNFYEELIFSRAVVNKGDKIIVRIFYS